MCEAVDAPFRRSVGVVVGSGLLFILISVGGGLSISRRFGRGMRSVALGAKALAQGERKTRTGCSASSSGR